MFNSLKGDYAFALRPEATKKSAMLKDHPIVFRLKKSILASFLIASPTITSLAQAESSSEVTLKWDAPTENTDGSPITGLGPYSAYIGTNSFKGDTNFTYSSSITTIDESATFTNLAYDTEYQFFVTASSTNGVDSEPSEKLNWRSPKRPRRGLLFRFVSLLRRKKISAAINSSP